MASSTVKVSLLADASQFKRAFGDADRTAQQTGAKFGAAGKLVAAAGGLMVASGIVNFLKDAAKAAAEDQKAQELLKLAIDNSTTSTGLQVDAVEPWIKKLSLATGVADDELRPALAELVRTTGDLSKAQDVMGVAMDIAAAKGIPLETVTKAIGKAALGNIGALGRLGVATKTIDGQVMTFEETLDEAARTMGGAAATAADTFAGRMAIAQVKVDEFKESVGNALIPSLADAADAGGDLVEVLGFVADKLNDIGGSEADDMSIWATIMRFSGFEGLLDGLGWVADKLGDVGTAAAKTENPFSGVISNLQEVEAESDDATEALQDFEDEVRSQMDPIFNLAQKVQGMADAQTNVAKARDEYGDGSPEHLTALRDEATAFYDLRTAQLKADGSASREQYELNLRAMGTKTEHEIGLMMQEFDKLDGRVIDTTINVGLKGRGASTFSDAISGKRAGGGSVGAGGAYVVGEDGPELLQMGSQGGRVVPNHKLGGAGTVINVHVTALDPAAAARAVVQALQQYNRTNGAIPITVRA